MIKLFYLFLASFHIYNLLWRTYATFHILPFPSSILYLLVYPCQATLLYCPYPYNKLLNLLRSCSEEITFVVAGLICLLRNMFLPGFVCISFVLYASICDSLVLYKMHKKERCQLLNCFPTLIPNLFTPRERWGVRTCNKIIIYVVVFYWWWFSDILEQNVIRWDKMH